MVGAVQFTPIEIGGKSHALLLGPLLIEDRYKNQGWGLKLMLEGMSRGREFGYEIVILVGDLPYYARAGFAPTPMGRIVMPGPVDPARLLYAELTKEPLRRFKARFAGLRNYRTPLAGLLRAAAL